MPSVSQKQHNFMEAAAHSPGFAKKAGVKQSVAKEFTAADAKGGKPKKKASPALMKAQAAALRKPMPGDADADGM